MTEVVSQLSQVLETYTKGEEPNTSDIKKIIEKDPETAVIVSKLTKRNTPPPEISPQTIHSLSTKLFKTKRDVDTMLGLFPDLRFACELILSGIINPDNLKMAGIHYKHTSDLPPTLSNGLITIIKDELEGEHKLSDRVDEIFQDALVNDGAHVRFIMPENTLDDVIHDALAKKSTSISVESLYGVLYTSNSDSSIREIDHHGYLGNTNNEQAINSFSFETALDTKPQTSYNPRMLDDIEMFKGKLTVYDNPYAAVVHRLYDTINTNRVEQTVYDKLKPFKYDVNSTNIGLESEIKVDYQTQRQAWRNKTVNSKKATKLPIGQPIPNKTITTLSIPTPQSAKRQAIGRPMDIKIPAHSVIPVHPPYDPSAHIGYFIAYKNGYPLSAEEMTEELDKIENVFQNSYDKTITQNNTNQLKTSVIGKDYIPSDCNKLTLPQLKETYSALIEHELTERLSNGLYGTKAKISKVSHLYEVLLSYALKGVGVQLIYVPSQLISYIARSYHSNGVGVSILYDAELIAGMRAILYHTRSMANIKNSIGSTEVNIEYSEDDTDVEKTKALIMGSIYDAKKSLMPQRVIDPSTIMDWVGKQGLHFTHSAHPDLPNTKITFTSDAGIKHSVPDEEWYNELKKSNSLALGVSSELVDASYSGEFATTDLNRHAITMKQVARHRTALFKCLTDYAKKLILYDEIILSKLRLHVKNNMKEFLKDNAYAKLKEEYAVDADFIDALINDFLKHLNLNAARNDGTDAAAMQSVFSEYAKAIEEAFDNLYPEELFAIMIKDGKFGLDKVNIDAKVVRGMYLSYLTSKKMSELNYLPELAGLFVKSPEGKYADIRGYYHSNIQAISSHIKSLKDDLVVKEEESTF